MDQENETILSQLENRFTSIHFTVNLVRTFFLKSLKKIHSQNSAVTSLGISLSNLPWFENNKGNLVFTSKTIMKHVMSQKSKARSGQIKIRSNKKIELQKSSNSHKEAKSERNIQQMGGLKEQGLGFEESVDSESEDDYKSFMGSAKTHKQANPTKFNALEEDFQSTRRNSELEPEIKMRYEEFGTLFK